MNMFGHMAKYAYYIFKEGVVNPNNSEVVNCHGIQRGYIDHHYNILMFDKIYHLYIRFILQRIIFIMPSNVASFRTSLYQTNFQST